MPRSRQSRGSWWLLALACVGGLAAGVLLRLAGPLGEDVSGQVDLFALTEDRASPSSGPADAPVTLVVFTDYQCPACRLAHPAMLRAAERAGDVRIVYRDLPIFGPVSDQAARVALANAEQGLYPQTHDAFMREPGPLDPPAMRRIVTRLGGNWNQVERTLAERGAIDRQLARNGTDALRLGVSGTPTYLIGPYRIVGALDEDGFEKAFAQARSSDFATK